MKRDMDLMREILRAIESCNNPNGMDANPVIEGYTPEQIAYHVELLCETGLLNGTMERVVGARYPKFCNINLSSKGHDFLEVSQDNKIWRTAKDKVLKPGTSFTLDLLFAFLKAKAAEKLGVDL